MKKWKSTKVTPHGVWASEIDLREVSTARRNKVNKLIKSSKDTFKEES